MNMFRFLPILLLFGWQSVQAQGDYPQEAAIIQDVDGYTNVRAAANGQAAVIRRVVDNEPFWFDTADYTSHKEWIGVEVAPGRFSDAPGIMGYMHRSRLKPLSSLPAYQGQSFAFKQTITPFRPKVHRISYGAGGTWVEKIDGLSIWGTDGTMPRKETTRLNVTINGQPVVIPQALYRNLYEPSPEYNVYRKGNAFFVEQFNSDGAGSYTVVWAFDSTHLNWRLIMLNA